eukprot:6185291-Pleurochrysis_carterae.AAC.1
MAEQDSRGRSYAYMDGDSWLAEPGQYVYGNRLVSISAAFCREVSGQCGTGASSIAKCVLVSLPQHPKRLHDTPFQVVAGNAMGCAKVLVTTRCPRMPIC